MDISQELKDTENALRDFIAQALSTGHGDSWVEQCGVTPERIQKWRERKATEAERQEAGVVDERLIYYADFYDLKTILKKNWVIFSDALGDWKTMEVYLTELERLRDPDAHRRELLPYQKNLILGIGGEIRARLVRYRNKQVKVEDYFPRIESARDSLGNIWTPDSSRALTVYTHLILRPGDRIDFVITATDPLGENLEYGVDMGYPWPTQWQTEGTFSVDVTEKHIGKNFIVALLIRSRRNHHAHGSYDDRVEFSYTVLPTRT